MAGIFANTSFSVSAENLLQNSRLALSVPDKPYGGVGYFGKGWWVKSQNGLSVEVRQISPADAPKMGMPSDISHLCEVVVTAQPGTSPSTASYLRQTQPLSGIPDGVRFDVQLCYCKSDETAGSLLFEVFQTAELKNSLFKKRIPLEARPGWHTTACHIAPSATQIAAMQAAGEVYALVQIFLPVEDGAKMWIAEAKLVRHDPLAGQAVRFRFDTFGGVGKASSRLRAWKIADVLRERGHLVTLNEGSEYDVYVCQKVQPAESLRAARRDDALLVYDFDDNYLLADKGTRKSLLSYLNLVDVVTVGSEYLRDIAAKYHPNVTVLPNPVDILSSAVQRAPRETLQRLGWFGAPENLASLEMVDTTEAVTTVTAGGDIPFDLNTVDRTLTEFDLLLFPLALDAWTLAKNANRMIKAIALGVPVLASRTPEHETAARTFGLGDDFLVGPGESWQAKIDALRADFARVQAEIGTARRIALETYGTPVIAEAWFETLTHSVKRWRDYHPDRERTAERIRQAQSWLPPTACVIVDFDADCRLGETLRKSEVPWELFTERHAVVAGHAGNLLGRFAEFTFSPPGEEYLDVFAQFDRLSARLTSEWVCFVRGGTVLTHGFLEELKTALTAPQPADVIGFASQQAHTCEIETPPVAGETRTMLQQPRQFGVMVVRRAWLARHPVNARDNLSYWSWALALEAMSDPLTRYHVVDVPVAIGDDVHSVDNIALFHHAWLRRHDPFAAENLPSLEKQWERIGFDIAARNARRHPEESPFALVEAVIANQSLRQQVKTLRQQVRTLEKKNAGKTA